MDESDLHPGIYPLTVEEGMILFRIGRRCLAIGDAFLFGHPGAPCRCLHDRGRRDRLFPLTQLPANRFRLGKYGDIEIVIHFNHVEIRRRFPDIAESMNESPKTI